MCCCLWFSTPAVTWQLPEHQKNWSKVCVFPVYFIFFLYLRLFRIKLNKSNNYWSINLKKNNTHTQFHYSWGFPILLNSHNKTFLSKIWINGHPMSDSDCIFIILKKCVILKCRPWRCYTSRGILGRPPVHSHSSLWCRTASLRARPLLWQVGQQAVCPSCLQPGQDRTSWQQNRVEQSSYRSQGRWQYLQSGQNQLPRRLSKSPDTVNLLFNTLMWALRAPAHLRWRRCWRRWSNAHQTQTVSLGRSPPGNAPDTCGSRLSAGKPLYTHPTGSAGQ